MLQPASEWYAERVFKIIYRLIYDLRTQRFHYENLACPIIGIGILKIETPKTGTLKTGTLKVRNLRTVTLKTGTPKTETLEIRAHKTQVFKNRGPYNQNLKKPPAKILFIVQKYLLFLL